MNIIDKMVQLTRLEDLFQTTIDDCSKEDLANCTRLLAINLAQYLAKYGKLSQTDLRKLFKNKEIDHETALLFTESMLQCTLALAQITGKHELIEEIKETVATTNALDTDTPAPTKKYLGETHFHSERLFHHRNLDNNEGGWYFSLRGGAIHGPFETREAALQNLEDQIKSFRENGDTGKR